MGDEADRLNDETEDLSEDYFDSGLVASMVQKYNAARTASIGSVIRCPTCYRQHQKTTYHKVFCSNGRRRGGNCKDRYWNIVDDTRRDRARNQ